MRQVVDGPLLRRRIPANRGAQGRPAVRSPAANRVQAGPLGRRVAEKMVAKVGTRKEVEGGGRLEEGASLSLVDAREMALKCA